MDRAHLDVPYWESPLYQGGVSPVYFYLAETAIPRSLKAPMRLIGATRIDPLEEAKLCERIILEGEGGTLATSL